MPNSPKLNHASLFILIIIISLPQFLYGWTLEERIKQIGPSVKIKKPELIKELKKKNSQLTLVAYKRERILEVWQSKPKSKKLKVYPLTGFSGTLGPKNKQGDKQIPEGIYKTTFLNPNSKYHLSIRLNYPNTLDQKRAKAFGIKDPGSDIYIHGKNKTVGCIPIGNSNIEELFYLIHLVGLKNTQVIISPSRLPFPTLKGLGINDQDHYGKKKYQKIQMALIKLIYPPAE